MSMEKENIFVLFAMVLRFVFTIKLNIDVNFAVHLNFVLMEEENQAVRIVVEEITVKQKTENLLHRLQCISNMFSQHAEISMQEVF